MAQPSFFTYTGFQANAQNLILFDFFNTSITTVAVNIVSILWNKKYNVVTGVITEYELYRISEIGTGGTQLVMGSFDRNNESIPGFVTARKSPTGGATVEEHISTIFINTDETTISGKVTEQAVIWPMGVPILPNGLQDLVIRADSGIALKQVGGTTSGGLNEIIVVFTLENLY